jgi:hypothetical protein
MPADLPGSDESRTDIPAQETRPIGPTWPPDRTGPAGPIGRAAPSWLAGLARRGPRSRRPFIFAGVAAVALLAGAAVAFVAMPGQLPSSDTSAAAARQASSPTPSGGSGRGNGRFGGFGGAGFGGAGFGPSLFGALHGQIVLAKPGGGYETADIQSGQVTAVSSTSITLRSADGFTKTYLVTSSTDVDAQQAGIASVRTGNQVSLVATVSGGTATATSIEDLTLLRQQRQSFGYPGQGGAPAPPAGQAG